MAKSFDWKKKDNLIVFPSFEYDGTTGLQWVSRLHRNDVRIPHELRDYLVSGRFIPTRKGLARFKIFRGSLFDDNSRNTIGVNLKIWKDGLYSTTIEDLCFIRELLRHMDLKEMNLWYILSCQFLNVSEKKYTLGAGLDSDGPHIQLFDPEKTNWTPQAGFAAKEMLS